jgi:hypothetical protein
METLKLYPIFPQGFDMTIAPFLLGQFVGPTLTEGRDRITASIFYADTTLKFTITLFADPAHPFEYRIVHGHKQPISGEIAGITVGASNGALHELALSAQGLHAPVVDVLQDLLTADSTDALVDLGEPGPITVKPAGSTNGQGDLLWVPTVRAIFDVRGVPGHEVVHLKQGDKVEVSEELYHNRQYLTHHLTSDGMGGWLLAPHAGAPNTVDLELANGHALTQAQALSHLMLHA